MCKKRIIAGIIALYLVILLVLVGRSVASLSKNLGKPVEQIQTEEVTLPKSEPDLLPDAALVVHNDVMDEDTVLLQGQVLARGQADSVTNLATGKILGYTLMCMGQDGQPHYDLYHNDGTHWEDCADLRVTGILGKYYVGIQEDTLRYVLTKAPGDPEASRATAELWKVGNNRCALWNVEGELMGINGFALVDESGNVISRLPREAQEYTLYANPQNPTDAFVLLSEDGAGLVSLQTLEVLPYAQVSCINDGYRDCTTKDGLHDLVAPGGQTLVSGGKMAYSLYREHTKIAVDSEGTVHIYVDDAEQSFDVSVSAGYWSGGFYVKETDGPKAWIYNNQGKLVEELSSGGHQRQVEFYSVGDLLLVQTASDARIFTSDGTSRSVREADGEALYSLSSSGEKACYLLSHSSGKTFRYDLLDENGTVVKGGLNHLSPTEVDGIFAARKGFVYGLMDETGNWLWCERIFESTQEEGSYNQREIGR